MVFYFFSTQFFQSNNTYIFLLFKTSEKMKLAKSGMVDHQ
jgi:hypothetical protein